MHVKTILLSMKKKILKRNKNRKSQLIIRKNSKLNNNLKTKLNKKLKKSKEIKHLKNLILSLFINKSQIAKKLHKLVRKRIGLMNLLILAVNRMIKNKEKMISKEKMLEKDQGKLKKLKKKLF